MYTWKWKPFHVYLERMIYLELKINRGSKNKLSLTLLIRKCMHMYETGIWAIYDLVPSYIFLSSHLYVACSVKENFIHKKNNSFVQLHKLYKCCLVQMHALPYQQSLGKFNLFQCAFNVHVVYEFQRFKINGRVLVLSRIVYSLATRCKVYISIADTETYISCVYV